MAAEQTATVQVAEGALRGRRVASSAGGSFWSFQGVPYARPPLGPLRFKDALPMVPWNGVRDALKEGSNCTQYNLIDGQYGGSEDCLFINVYTPKLPQEGANQLPVMIYIHGGGYMYGSGDSLNYGADFLVADDVILVTFNYRLGPLGFLYLGEDATGNQGLKDQVAALRWVQKNIAAFGGNPGNVTLFGESAGGASVEYHMLSPLSKGLFHRGIAMSGSVLNPWAVNPEPEETARRLARALGCTSDDDDAMVQFLRSVDHDKLVRSAHKDAASERDKGRLLTFSFLPTPDRVLPGVEIFLPAPVEQLVEEGRYHDLPYITGVTGQEALFLLSFANLSNFEVARAADTKWEANVLPELRLPVDPKKKQLAMDALRRFYMGGKPLSEENFSGYLDMYSDLSFGEGVAHTLKSMIKTHSAPIYQYIFTADDKLNAFKIWMKVNRAGTAHIDDLGYLFKYEVEGMDAPVDSPAGLIRKRFVRLWTNFAKTGNPTPTPDPLVGKVWKPYTKKQRNYLEIGSQLTTGTNLHAERLAFWEKFYATYV